MGWGSRVGPEHSGKGPLPIAMASQAKPLLSTSPFQGEVRPYPGAIALAANVPVTSSTR